MSNLMPKWFINPERYHQDSVSGGDLADIK